jgi:hypothetical protein
MYIAKLIVTPNLKFIDKNYPDDAEVLAIERIGRWWGTVNRNGEPSY